MNFVWIIERADAKDNSGGDPCGVWIGLIMLPEALSLAGSPWLTTSGRLLSLMLLEGVWGGVMELFAATIVS